MSQRERASIDASMTMAVPTGVIHGPIQQQLLGDTSVRAIEAFQLRAPSQENGHVTVGDILALIERQGSKGVINERGIERQVLQVLAVLEREACESRTAQELEQRDGRDHGARDDDVVDEGARTQAANHEVGHHRSAEAQRRQAEATAHGVRQSVGRDGAVVDAQLAQLGRTCFYQQVETRVAAECTALDRQPHELDRVVLGKERDALRIDQAAVSQCETPELELLAQDRLCPSGGQEVGARRQGQFLGVQRVNRHSSKLVPLCAAKHTNE